MASSSRASTGDHATLTDFLRVLGQRRALVLLVASLVFVSTAVVTAFQPKWWLATATVRVEKPEGEVKLFQQSSGNYDPYFLQDQFKIMQSAKILYPVIVKLGLGAIIAKDLGSPTPLPTDLACDYFVRRMLRVEAARGSSLVEIGVSARDPVLAARIANEIADGYSADRIDFATSGQSEGFSKLKQELAAQEATVSAQRDAVEKLRHDLNLAGVDLNSRTSDLEIETLRQMQNTLIALTVDATGRRTRWERFKGIPPEQRLTLVNSEQIPDPNLQNLLQAYLIADQKVTQLQPRLGEAHPDLVAAVNARGKIREQLDGLLTGYERSLELSYHEAEARVAELKNQLGQARVDQILSARDRIRPFEEAAQKLEDETRLLTTLKLTLRQREIDFQVPKHSIEILSHAEPPHQPNRPSWPLNLTLALIFGGLLGIGAAVLVEFADTSIRNVADLETRLQRAVLGVIPLAPASASADARGPAAEPFRVLHTGLNLAAKAPGTRSLLLLSAGPGEGKSTTLRQLARVMAAAGERVLLIDSDLRRPTQHHLAGRPRSPGLADWLQERATFAAVLQPAIEPNFDFIAAGDSAHFSLGLPQAARLRALIDELRPRYDKILLDSPPVIGVSDTAALASVVDDVVLLVQHRRNPASMVLRAQQLAESQHGPLLGTVLNQVPARGGDDYGYYTSNYDYYAHDDQSGRKPSRSAKPAAPTGEKSASGPERINFNPPGDSA